MRTRGRQQRVLLSSGSRRQAWIRAEWCAEPGTIAPTGALSRNSKARGWADLPVEKEPIMKRILGAALVAMVSLALAAPVSAGRGPGGGFHGGFHHGGFHHGGFHRFGCCFGP